MKTTLNLVMLLLVISGLVLIAGCTSPSQRVGELRLGDTPDDVLRKLGRPFTVRAAKLYENDETTEVWEYVAPVFSFAFFADQYDKDYWVIFENGKVVQWGQPGDFSGTDTVTGDAAVKDFLNKKVVR